MIPSKPKTKVSAGALPSVLFTLWATYKGGHCVQETGLINSFKVFIDTLGLVTGPGKGHGNMMMLYCCVSEQFP